MTDAKEWVTIKIPKHIRDDAKDDARTYGEIMRAGLGETVEVRDEHGEVVETIKNELSMANEPGVKVDVEGVTERLDKAIELAEQTRDNTIDIKETLGR